MPGPALRVRSPHRRAPHRACLQRQGPRVPLGVSRAVSWRSACWSAGSAECGEPAGRIGGVDSESRPPVTFPVMRPSVRRCMARWSLVALAALVVGPGLGCNTYADSLTRAQRAFEQSEHERTLAILRTLEPDIRRLSESDRAKYCYLRGLTDYRIGYRLEARHWLSLASAVVKETPDALPADWA